MLKQLNFGISKSLPVHLQTETSECGLACISMILGYYGRNLELSELRHHHRISQKGSTLDSIVRIAEREKLTTRPVSLDLQALKNLKTPCVLHWNFNHFVVLKEVKSNAIIVHDPGVGERKISLKSASASFTGVALELWPSSDFEKINKGKDVSVRSIVGRLDGLLSSVSYLILISIALEIFILASPFYMKLVIDEAIVSGSKYMLTVLAISFSVVVVLQHLTGLLRSWSLMHLATSWKFQWRANIFSHLIKLPIEYFERRHVGDVISRLHSVDHINKVLTTSLIEALIDGAMTIVAFSIMWNYDSALTLLSVATILSYWAARLFTYTKLRYATEEEIVQSAKQQTHLLETIRGIKPIKSFQKEIERKQAWLSLFVRQINANLTVQKLSNFNVFASGVLFGLSNVIVIFAGARYCQTGEFTVGTLVSFIAFKMIFDARILAFTDKYYEVKMLRVQAGRLADIVEAEPETLDEIYEINHNDFVPTLEVKDLKFRHSKFDPYTLDGINLKISAGDSIAITGPSGCGKTTFLNILAGALQPTEGDVLIGGHPMNHINLKTLRHNIASVQQDDVLFAGSIFDNICLFDPNPDGQWIRECATLAGVNDEIMKMPMKYNTLVGDMGSVLSGGQKQRILIARALYKRPKILLLDEATSHLDSENEKRVNDSIRSLAITRVMVAHRNETLISADRIVHIVNGKVIDNMPLKNAS